MAQNSKRGRHNNRRRQGGSNPNRSLDSTGPEVKIRGTASQIFEKYQALARDAFSAGDRVRAESLAQHAEHYFRMMNAMQAEVDKREEQRNEQRQDNRPDNRPDNRQDQRQNAGSDSSAERPPEAAKSNAGASDAAALEENSAHEAIKSPDEASGEETAPKPRRPRRRRTPRKSAESGENSVEGSESTEPPVPAE